MARTAPKQFCSAGPMTLNNVTLLELEHLCQLVDAPKSKIKYIVWIQEVGEEGTPHLQIYAQAFVSQSVIAWHKLLGDRVSNIVSTESTVKRLFSRRPRDLIVSFLAFLLMT